MVQHFCIFLLSSGLNSLTDLLSTWAVLSFDVKVCRQGFSPLNLACDSKCKEAVADLQSAAPRLAEFDLLYILQLSLNLVESSHEMCAQSLLCHSFVYKWCLFLFSSFAYQAVSWSTGEMSGMLGWSQDSIACHRMEIEKAPHYNFTGQIRGQREICN